MTKFARTPLDSKAGMQVLADAARSGRLVLNEYHEQLAKKHGVSLEGVTISRPFPDADRIDPFDLFVQGDLTDETDNPTQPND